MNMKQRLAFSALLVTPVIVATAAPNASAFTDLTADVYDTIYIDLSQLDGTIEKYSWAILDGTVTTPFQGYTSNFFVVKPEHSGKVIQVTAHLADGTTESSITMIEPLIPAFKGKSTLTTQNGVELQDAFEGLTLQAKPAGLMMENSNPEVLIPSTDTVYSYTWYKVVGNTREKINNAVASYTIPDTFRKNIVGPVSVEVEIAASIKGLKDQAAIIDRVRLEVKDDPVNDLLANIDALMTTPPQKFYTYNMAGRTLAEFKAHVNTLQLTVNSLPGTLTTKITNVNTLQVAAANITSAESFIEQKTKAMTTNDPLDLERAKKAASNLNQLQLSLVQSDYDDLYNAAGSNAQLPEADIQAMNESLLELYTFTDVNDLNAHIETIEQQLAALPKQVHGLVQLQHLTKAKQNSNAVRGFTNKLALIGEAAEEETTAKDLKAAQSAYTVYAKLTHEQAKLVPEDDLAFIENVLANEQTAALTLKDAIDELYTTLVNDTQLETTAEFVDMQQQVEMLNNDYKRLSSKARKFVTNYDQLKEIRASLKDAARTESLIRQLAAIDPATNLKSARSKLQAAQKATLKLSKVEHALLLNKEDLLEYADNVNEAIAMQSDPYTALAQSFSTNIEQWGVFTDYMTYGDASAFASFSAFETEVSELNKQFKALAAKERNSLPSKLFLKTATSDIKAIKNVMKKITAAISEPKPTKQYSRILAAERAYAKLSAAQQSLLTLPYQGGQLETPYEQLQNKKIEVMDVSSLNTTLATFKTEGYDRPIKDLQLIVSGYNGLNSAIKHLVTENAIVKTISKDIKVVQNLQSKFGSIIANIDAEKTSTEQKLALIAAYERLTFTQHSLLQHVEGLEELDEIIASLRAENVIASVTTLYKDIDALIANGRYTEKATLQHVRALQETYKTLKPDERRVITNYDSLTIAEKHIQNVTALNDSKPADLTTSEGKAWLEKTTNLKPLEASLLQ